MKELEGTKTQANLLAAFAGECMARTKYDFYGDKAKKDGFEQIAALFYQTADNERAHAKIWFKLLHGELRHTSENLFDSAEGEYAEWADMYKAFAIAAKEEGFDEIALMFEKVANIEQSHEQRYRQLLDNVNKGTVFEKAEQKEWVCLNCGHVHFGTQAPEKCPTCSHPQSFFADKSEVY
ncbi:MAG: rubrerythrin family protein [Clostridia bacterium]|nr:rubrerythrin family protein [Clostridia bacterium]